MGIKGFYQIDHVKEIATKVGLSFFQGKRIALDGNSWIRKWLYALTETDRASFLQRAVNAIQAFKSQQMKPLVTFDGKGFLFKLQEQAKRTEAKKRKKNNLEDAMDIVYMKQDAIQAKKQKLLDEKDVVTLNWKINTNGSIQINILPIPIEEQKLDPMIVIQVEDLDSSLEEMQEELKQQELKVKKAENLVLIEPTKQDYDRLKHLFKLLNVPVIESPMENDFTCPALQRQGIVDCVFGDDSDFFSHGISVARTFDINASDGITYYDINTMLNQFGFDQVQLRTLCWIIGNDYTPGIKGLGINKAVVAMKKHKSLEAIIEAEKKDCEKTILLEQKKKPKLEKTRLERDNKIKRNQEQMIHLDEFLVFYNTVNVQAVDDNIYKVDWKEDIPVDMEIVTRYIDQCLAEDAPRQEDDLISLSDYEDTHLSTSNSDDDIDMNLVEEK